MSDSIGFRQKFFRLGEILYYTAIYLGQRRLFRIQFADIRSLRNDQRHFAEITRELEIEPSAEEIRLPCNPVPVRLGYVVPVVLFQTVKDDIRPLYAEILHEPHLFHEKMLRSIAIEADHFLSVVSGRHETFVGTYSSPVHESGEIVPVTVLGIPFHGCECIIYPRKGHVEVRRAFEEILGRYVALDLGLQKVAGNPKPQERNQYKKYSFHLYPPAI